MNAPGPHQYSDSEGNEDAPMIEITYTPHTYMILDLNGMIYIYILVRLDK